MRIFLTLLTVLTCYNLYAQPAFEKDSVFLNYLDKNAHIKVMKINKVDTSILKELTFPFYILKQPDFLLTKSYLQTSSGIINKLTDLDKWNALKDSVSVLKEETYEYLIKQSNERIENYKVGFDQSQLMNKSYCDLLEESLQMNKKQIKKNRWNNAQIMIWGFLGGGLLGTYIGLQAAK